MKGSLEGVLPMLALFIIAGTVSFQSIPIAEALSDVLGDSTSDINRIVDSRVYGEFYYYNSIPQVAEYAVNDAAYDQGHNGGNITWSNGAIDTYSTVIGQIRDNWQNESETNFNLMLSPSSSNSCQIVEDEDKEYDINIYPSTIDFSNTDELYTLLEPDITDETVEAKCSFESGSSLYREDIEVSPEVEATSNRYIQLADETTRFFIDLQEEFSSISGESDTQSSCGSPYPSYSSVEENAAEDLESEFQSAIDNAESGYPERDGFEVELNVLVDTTYDHGYSSNLVEVTSRDDRWTGNCCSGCNNPNRTNSYRHYTEVELDPSRTELSWNIVDAAQQVIVRENSENLEFTVDSYEYEFQ